MARRVQEDDLQAIEAAVRRQPEGMTAQQINDALESPPPYRTLQYRLKSLVESKRLVMEGAGRSVRYRVPQVISLAPEPAVMEDSTSDAWLDVLLPISEPGADIREQVRRPLEAREPVGYNRDFLDRYRPNETFYLSAAEREQLREAGEPNIAEQPAGTYARQILNRLLIDLSWNSSRLEGNTYSLLETERLLDAGEEADGKARLETQMILNHRDAIEFLVDSADEIGFNRYTILNLHALLANNLLADPDSAGRLRRIGVGITGSVFHPLEAPQLIEECFRQILATASAIADPFEQAFFVMVQIPYLQPFDDVDKRVSRLTANIPLIRANLSPLSFEDVPLHLYTEGVLGVYELNRIELLRDVFVRAYRRSAARYVAVRQSLGEPDPFRMRHRVSLREVVGAVVRGCMDKKQAAAHVGAWTRENVGQEECERFREVAERELLGLHEGNFARYRVRPSEFAAWREAWNRSSANHRHPHDGELSGPLRIAEVPIPGSGSLGITHCPGRNTIDSAGCRWKRSLRDDLRDLTAWGAGAVLTLVEDHEFARLGVPEFATEMRGAGLVWYHMPIPDMAVPGKAFDEAWARDGARILGSLRAGERVLVHCAGGLGRSGMVAAKLQAALGASAIQAVAAVRRARPGAIETDGQLDYVLHGPSLAAGVATHHRTNPPGGPAGACAP